MVRHTVGYARLETETKQNLVDGKTVKRYDQAATPFRQVLASDQVALVAKAHLSNLYVLLNPVTLRHRIDEHVDYLWKIVQ